MYIFGTVFECLHSNRRHMCFTMFSNSLAQYIIGITRADSISFAINYCHRRFEWRDINFTCFHFEMEREVVPFRPGPSSFPSHFRSRLVIPDLAALISVSETIFAEKIKRKQEVASTKMRLMKIVYVASYRTKTHAAKRTEILSSKRNNTV